MAQDIGGSVGIEADGGTPAARPGQRFRIPVACAVLVAWMLVTTWNPFNIHASNGLVGALTEAPQWGMLFAALLLVVLTAAGRWTDLGLNLPISARSLLLLWLPAIYLLGFAALDVAAGPPPLPAVGFLLLNVLLGAVSEEMMFRGVLFAALRTRLRLVPAVAISAALFGLVHLLNAAVLGSLEVAAAQAVAAAMSGVLFTAIRLRTGSLLPAIVYHAAWDFASLMAVTRLLGSDTGAAPGTAAGIAGGTPSLALLAAPIVLLMPNFLYALFLLRRPVKSR